MRLRWLQFGALLVSKFCDGRFSFFPRERYFHQFFRRNTFQLCGDMWSVLVVSAYRFLKLLRLKRIVSHSKKETQRVSIQIPKMPWKVVWPCHETPLMWLKKYQNINIPAVNMKAFSFIFITAVGIIHRKFLSYPYHTMVFCGLAWAFFSEQF